MKYWLRTLKGYQAVEVLDDALVNGRKIGTLGYTRGGTFAVFLFLCLGYAGYVSIQSILNTVLPKLFFNEGASNKTIAFFITTMPYIINMILTPILSFRSDRTRTRFGRRMPYLIVTTPLIALFGCLLGWYAWIGNGIDGILPPAFSGFGKLLTLGSLAVVYQLLFMVPSTVFWYLFPDVVPSDFIGRLMAYFHLIGSAMGWFLNTFFLKFAEDHVGWLFSIVALFFLVCMAIMIAEIREGDYPPPPETGKGDSIAGTIVGSIRVYCRECYSIGFYYWFFLTMALSEISMVCRNMYNMIYATESLGITTENFGRIMGWSGVVGLALSLPLGYLCDKFNALKVFALGLVLVILVNLGSFYLVKDERTFFITAILLAIVYSIQMVATIPVFVMILPKPLYGQFSSANALFRAFFMAIAGFGGGALLDAVGNYQYIYLWDFVFTLAALCTFTGLYVSWKRRGGKQGYVAPMVEEKKRSGAELQ